MGDAKSIKERGILEQVIKSELDFITYVDVHTGTFHVIVTNDDTDVTPPPEGDYTQVNAQMIPLYVHPKDREACAAALELPHILSELEQRDDLVVSYRLLCGEVYRRKELHISYQQDDRGTVVLVRRDVTESYEEEQRQQERLMSALSDARHANQEKNEFLERMSHEIRTPMNSIIGLTYLTREYVNNEKQVLENLDKISQSARFMLSFVDDILNLSQIESGNVALNSQKVVLDAFLEETVEEAMRQGYEALREQFAAVREAYPGAQLHEELESPVFMRLVMRGVDARSAYELTHLRELRAGAMAYGARRAREELTVAMQAGYLRPRESGMAPAAFGAFAESPEHWSRQTREELKARARRGETVRL